MANNDLIALIDSDNIVDETYFQIAQEYMKKMNEQNETNKLHEYFIISPCWGRPHNGMDCRKYANHIIDINNIKNYIAIKSDESAIWQNNPLMWNVLFISLLNMGNYILSKNIIHNITFDIEMLPKTISCDVMYFHSLVFKQLEGFQFHIVEKLEYDHVIHNGSIQLEYSNKCNETLWEYLVPYFYNRFN